MRAVTFDHFGEPAEVLSVKDVPTQELSPGMVRVRMLASPVNPSDLMTIRGIYTKRPPLPAVPGYEGVGLVDGANVGLYGKFLMGKRVAVLNSHGGNWQDQVILPAKFAIPLDQRLNLEQAATFFVNPAAAFVMTRRLLSVPKDAWLLQTAAGSELGKMIIRLGRRYGFRTVNVVRRAEQFDELKSLGADAVLCFDGERDDPALLKSQLTTIVGTDGIQFAIDPVGGKTASAIVSCLGQNGRLLLYGTLTTEPISFSPRDLMTVGARVEGFWLSNFMNTLGLLGKLSLIRTISRLILEGVLSSEVGETFPLTRIADAVRAAERPGKHGKVLLKIGD